MNGGTSLTLAGILFLSCFASLVNLGLCAKPWDVLLFAQNWPTSVCDNYLEQGNGRSCRQYPKNMWTVHGIWPTQFRTLGPGFCDNSNPFNANAIRSIETQLDIYWTPVLIKPGPKTGFWAHEWNKHGTCATNLNQLSTQTKYFNQAIEWAKKYNMINILGAAGIKPGQEYTFQDLRNGIKQVVNKNPQILCYVNKKRQSTLLEVRLCFSKSLELVDCDGTVVGKNSNGLLTNCRTNQRILYPAAK